MIERTLGAGAFGTVYLARDPLIGRAVALKVLTQAGEPGGSNLALREVRAVGRLQSPHVVTLYRVHPPDDEHPWMFELEFVEGGSLAALLEREGALPVERAVRIAREVAQALRDAGREGVVHGDVKPRTSFSRRRAPRSSRTSASPASWATSACR